MRRKTVQVALLIAVVLIGLTGVAAAQGEKVTLEGLAEQVAKLFANQNGIAERLSTLETRTAPTPTPIATTTPASAAKAKPTPAPDTVLVVRATSSNARSGPGTRYGLLGVVTQGDIFVGPLQIESTATSTWYQFCCLADDQMAWIPRVHVLVKNKGELTLWEQTQSSVIEVGGEELLRYNDDYVGKIVYFSNVPVVQSLDEEILVVLDSEKFDHPAWLIYENASPRVIAGDNIDFMAEVVSLYTYETSGRGALTVPLLRVVVLRLAE